MSIDGYLAENMAENIANDSQIMVREGKPREKALKFGVSELCDLHLKSFL